MNAPIIKSAGRVSASFQRVLDAFALSRWGKDVLPYLSRRHVARLFIYLNVCAARELVNPRSGRATLSEAIASVAANLGLDESTVYLYYYGHVHQQ